MFEDLDDGFYAAVNSLIQQTKRPIVMTTGMCTIQSLPNSLLYGQDSAEMVCRPQAEAPFQNCPDRTIVNLVGIVFV